LAKARLIAKTAVLLMRWTALFRLAAIVAGPELEEARMDNITTIGLDIAKSVFQVHGVDSVGAVSSEGS
jgi:hypothetical protein